jgi:hypothetical protein
MSGKNATASDVDRQHIARPTANWAMSAPTPRPISSDHRIRRPTQQDAYELRSEPQPIIHAIESSHTERSHYGTRVT